MIKNAGVSNGWTVLSVNSETVDSSNVFQFKAGMQPFRTAGAKLILDLGAVEFMDSSALGALLTATRAVEASGGALRLVSLTPPVRTLFELVRLHRVFDIMNDLAEAAA
ncbi:MAG: STAS domain-containing protein [Vicinamibacteria bacterium]|nr:STAS domain-containing protein [Vicinamibacteria bacterium]